MLITIITPTKNAGSTLSEALESVALQQREDVEHIIVDAVSSDETLEVASEFSSLRIISEPDLGIYDGMNKGAHLARGEWLLFLQADDWLPPGSILAYQEAIREHPEAEMICGSAEAVRYEKGGWKRVWVVSEKADRELSVRNIALGEPMINARLIRKDAFERLDGFSLKYSLASDRDFLLRAVQSGIVQEEIAFPTYRYRWHDGSSTMNEGNALSGRLLGENLEIVRIHLSKYGIFGKKDLLRWHRNLTVQGAMNSLENRGRNLARYVVSGCSADILWPAAFITEILRSLPGFLARGCTTRSGRISSGGML